MSETYHPVYEEQIDKEIARLVERMQSDKFCGIRECQWCGNGSDLSSVTCRCCGRLFKGPVH